MFFESTVHFKEATAGISYIVFADKHLEKQGIIRSMHMHMVIVLHFFIKKQTPGKFRAYLTWFLLALTPSTPIIIATLFMRAIFLSSRNERGAGKNIFFKFL
jgi:hypothetical protein